MNAGDMGMAIFLIGFIGGPLLCGFSSWLWKMILPALYTAIVRRCNQTHNKRLQRLKENRLRSGNSRKRQTCKTAQKV